MLWHCGLLDPAPGENETLSRIRRHYWQGLPPEVEYELGIWLAMPGFSNRYHAETLHQDQRLIARHVGGYEKRRSEVLANWLSASREDCIKLCYLRPDKGHVPLLSLLQMRRDYYYGKAQNRIAEEYCVSPYLVNQLSWDLPERLMKNIPPEVREAILDDHTVNHLAQSSTKKATYTDVVTKLLNWRDPPKVIRP